ncbi:15313_t:CDS:2 [Cetraspora pellucida]|uniref:15313_t:CDS:1 n=1 Tax=Cetraspora pellucida TaxID=1433469 RepID=A0ACA9KE80_9GLOM|nr:15313_t:CDS:2 [Cetraspora pellucida]
MSLFDHKFSRRDVECVKFVAEQKETFTYQGIGTKHPKIYHDSNPDSITMGFLDAAKHNEI